MSLSLGDMGDAVGPAFAVAVQLPLSAAWFTYGEGLPLSESIMHAAGFAAIDLAIWWGLNQGFMGAHTFLANPVIGAGTNFGVHALALPMVMPSTFHGYPFHGIIALTQYFMGGTVANAFSSVYRKNK